MAKKIKSRIQPKSDFDTVELEAHAYLEDNGWNRVYQLCKEGKFAEAVRIRKTIEDTYRDVAKRAAEKI